MAVFAKSIVSTGHPYKVATVDRGGGVVMSGKRFFSALNAMCGGASIFIGIFLAEFDFLFIQQPQDSDAFILIQAHWIAVGAFSLLVSQSKGATKLFSALLLIWLMLNGWLGGKALLVGDPKFAWVLAFPVISFLNFYQLIAQGDSDSEAEDEHGGELEPSVNEPAIPADFYELHSSSPASALKGLLSIVLVVSIQLLLMVLFFFYGTLIIRVIFEGASVDFARMLDALGGVFREVLYIPVIIVAVYSIVFLVQLLIEKMAVGRGSDVGDDANRALSVQERSYIEEHIGRIGGYLAELKFPALYGWFYWPSIFGMIGLFLAFPMLVVWIEAEFFDPVKISGIPQADVISVLGPAYIGGVVFSFLFGSTLYWAVFQWLGARYRSIGEYLHTQWGWNSMNTETRPLESYAKIFTRFVRKRRYSPEQQVEPQQFLRDAYDEFAGFIYKATVVLGVAAVLFTVLDVSWRRVVHTGGLHYSPYLDVRSSDLTLDDIVRVELRCFLYNKGDDGERNPGVGYDIVFSNGMRGYLLEAELSGELLDKVEAIDQKLRERGVPAIRAKRAGAVFLRSIDGYWPNCAEAVLTKLDEEYRARVGSLIEADAIDSAPEGTN
ncbi:hypothetical protein [Hyphococcus sp.]|uniref:hypothetical protein n=1 Tax=Hyphococcus sp. TaxID=2038636 RepID=UPI00208C7770|nr:MAG: hypothetical protein DHS20C04_24420 [Marinicaulis sp.]